MSLRILYINHYAGSPDMGMEYRPYYLGTEWVRQGHFVRVLAASYSHLRLKNPHIANGVETRLSIKGVDYCFYKTPPYRGNGVARVRNILTFLWRIGRLTSSIAREFRPDLVIASSTYPMDARVAYRIAKRAKAKFVFEVHDLWPLTPIELNGMSRWHPFILWCQRDEDFAYRYSDCVISMLPCARSYMESRGMAGSKFHCIPNGIDLEDWRDTDGEPPTSAWEAIQAARNQGMTIVGYAGFHGTANALSFLIEAMTHLTSEKLFLVLVGDGPLKPALQAEANRLGIRQVVFLEQVPKSHIPAILSRFDIAYLGWLRHPLYRFGISPNKLMDYMMAGLPIVHSVDAGNDPVAEAGCGVTVPPEDPMAIARALVQLAKLNSEQRQEMGDRGRQFVMKHRTYPHLAQRFLEHVSACGKRDHGE